MLPRLDFRWFVPVLLLLAAPALQAADPPELVTAVEGIAEYRLDNGLKVLLFPDPSKPQVTVNLTVFVGSRHEGYGEAGMAHLLEHMLFKGTPDHPNIPKVLKEHGARFNGSTWLDRTNYFETLPATPENLEFAIRLEADRLVNSYVKREDLESEMTVVRNEFERGENSPSSVLRQRMMAVAYEWHNYGQSTIGNRADIERVPIENLQDFYRRYYQPDNAMVIVAGDFNPERALEYIQKYFGSIPRPQRQLPTTYTEEPAQDGERRVILRRVGDVALAGAAYHIPSGAHPDYVSVDVLEHILTSAPSGRLYEALVKTNKAASIGGMAYALHDPGVLLLMAEVASEQDPRALLDEMLAITESVGVDGVTAEEVERAKLHWLKNWELAMADSAGVAVQLSEWAAQGDWRLMFLYRDRLEQVTPDSVQRVAASYLQPNNRTLGLFLPTEETQRVPVPATPDLASMIGDYQGREALATGEAFDVSPESIETRTVRSELPVGLEVALLPKKTRGESVQIDLTLRYGNEQNLHDKNLACEVLPQLMLRGTQKLSRQQLQDALDKNRVQIRPSGEAGAASFTIETRRENLVAVLDLLRQILREPTLPADELEIIRTSRIASLRQQQTDPQSLAYNALSRRISPYPPGHPHYQPTIPESIELWQALTADDVSEIYRDYLAASHGELAIVGDFDPDAVRPILEQMLSGWESSRPYAHIPRKGDIELSADRRRIETPDKENAVYLAATVFPLSDDHEDYAPLVIGNYILGSSGLSSRLGDRVRQQEGLSYGVGSMFSAQSLDPRALLMIYAITNPANMAKVETAIREELERLLGEGITAEELAAAQRGYLEQQNLRRADDGTLASTLADTLHTDRTMAYYADLEQQIAGLTVDRVNAALREHIDLDRLALVEAGDFAKTAAEQTAEPATE
jgi:zinc protease